MKKYIDKIKNIFKKEEHKHIWKYNYTTGDRRKDNITYVHTCKCGKWSIVEKGVRTIL